MNNTSADHGITLRGFGDSSLIVAIALIAAVVAEQAIRWGESGSFGMMGGLLVSLLIVAAWFYTFFKPLKRLIGTPHFAVTSLLFLAGATALGTFVKQHASAVYYQDTFGVFWGRMIEFSGLQDVFHSWWYITLFLLLAGSLIVVSLTRKFTRANLSFHLAHLSPIVILFGVWLDFFYGMRGIMHMEVGEKNNVVHAFHRNTNYLSGELELDFSLRLDQFDSEKFDPDYKVQIWKTRENKDPEIVAAVPVNLNRPQRVHSTDVSFRVVDYFPNYGWDYEAAVPLEEMEPKDPILIARVKSNQVEETIQLRSNYARYNSIVDPYDQSNIEFAWTMNDRHRALIGGGEKITPHFLRLIDSTGQETAIEATVGTRYKLPGTTSEIHLSRFYDNLVYNDEKGEYFDGDKSGQNPAIEVVLRGHEEPVKFYLFSNFSGHQSPEIARARMLTGFDFIYNYYSGQGMLIVGEDRSIYHIRNGSVEKDELRIGYPYLFEGRLDAYFLVTHLFPDAAQVNSIPTNLSDDPVNPLAIVEVSSPGKETLEEYLMPPRGNKDALLKIEGHPYFLALESTREQETKFWKSHVSFLDKQDNVLNDGIIQVNQPVKFRGYRFYQTDFDPRRSNYSGIGVSREPGLGIIYIGFGMMVIGVLMMFYFREQSVNIGTRKMPGS